MGLPETEKKIGVVLVGYGEPRDCSKKAIRRFCKSVLFDRSNSSGNRLAWWLRVKFGMLGSFYRECLSSFQAVWPEGDFPEWQALRALSEQLQRRLESEHELLVCAATLYGPHSIKNAFSQLKDNNCNKIIIFPLFPQTSFSIKGALRDKVKKAHAQCRLKSQIVFVENYYRNEMYTRALAASIEHAGFDEKRGDRLLLAYRSIPTIDIERGDDYELQAGATSLAIASQLDLPRNAWTMAYFAVSYDRREHLDPYVRDVVQRWGKFCEGRMFVVCPGYSCENVRTQYYVQRTLRREFARCRCDEEREKGKALDSVGCDFVYVPTLGKTRAHLKVITTILASYLREGE